MVRKRAFTLIELLVVMAIIALLLSLLLPALAKARAAARQVKDGTQIGQIHKGWLIWSNDFEGIFPTPGLIARKPLTSGPLAGQIIPGRGEEDLEANSHANLYSACVMGNFMSTQLLISPSESSGRVVAASNYNFELYNPTQNVHWDPVFKTDLETICNTSYGTMPLIGQRKKVEWRNTLNSKFAVVGNRGVKNGDLDPTVYNVSKTLEIHGTRKKWEGNICFNDNHVTFEETFFPEGLDVTTTAGIIPDNLFAEDVTTSGEGSGHDVWLCMVPELQGQTDPQLMLSWD